MLHGVVTGVSGDRLRVTVAGEEGESLLGFEDFGDWSWEPGDRVMVVENDAGRLVKPFVVTVDAPLPEGAAEVRLGERIEVAGFSPRVTSPTVLASIVELARTPGSSSVHWLLSENSRTGEHRVFGLVAR